MESWVFCPSPFFLYNTPSLRYSITPIPLAFLFDKSGLHLFNAPFVPQKDYHESERLN